MGYAISTAYSFDRIEENLVAIDATKEKVLILGDIEQFLLEKILVMSETELVELALREFASCDNIAEDIHEFIQSLIDEGVIVEKSDSVETTDH